MAPRARSRSPGDVRAVEGRVRLPAPGNDPRQGQGPDGDLVPRRPRGRTTRRSMVELGCDPGRVIRMISTSCSRLLHDSTGRWWFGGGMTALSVRGLAHHVPAARRRAGVWSTGDGPATTGRDGRTVPPRRLAVRPLVARADELAELGDAVDAGYGAVLSGHDGVGKSALAAHVAECVERAGRPCRTPRRHRRQPLDHVRRARPAPARRRQPGRTRRSSSTPCAGSSSWRTSRSRASSSSTTPTCSTTRRPWRCSAW